VIILLLLLFILVVVHIIAAVVATRVIAARIEDENPPEGVFAGRVGARVHLHELGTGSESRLPILLLHGATSNARDMVCALGTDLARNRRVIAPDRPGHGWSDRPGGRFDASPARQAEIIVEALKQRGVERFVVVGHSWAGALAATLALDHPRQVAGLVILSGATHPWAGGVNWYYRLSAMPVLGSLFVHTVMTPVGSWGLRKSADEAFIPHAGPPDYIRRSAASLVLRPKEFRWNGQDVADLKAFLARQSPRYGNIAVPTAIIADPDDHVVHTRIHAEPLSRQIAGAKLTLISGAGHQIHYTARQAVLAEIERIAARAEAPPRPRNDGLPLTA
jgi:pimeloyl-ACP methyl ester carboxylesterase